MLSRFAELTGVYVLHCHILDHEDRGMMQMVQVISATTTMDITRFFAGESVDWSRRLAISSAVA